MDTEVTLRKRRSCPLVNTLCRRDTHWMTLVDPKFISLTTIQVGKRIKENKEREFGCVSYNFELDKIIIFNFILFRHICTLIYKLCKNDEIYQLAKDQALVKKF
jgi:hypothetical protein